jgi:hypothetical protein
MDLELTDEQSWLGESLDDAARARGGRGAAHAARSAARCGALRRRRRGLGAVELCLIARRSARTWRRPVPRQRRAALRRRAGPRRGRVALACSSRASWAARRHDGRRRVSGRKVPSSTRRRRRLAVVAPQAGLGIVAPRPGRSRAAASTPRSRCTRSSCRRRVAATPAASVRLTAIGALLAAAESVGAAERMLDDARATPPSAASSAARSAATRRCATSSPTCTCASASAWSTVLYAAAALDDDAGDAQRTASIAKAYVARAAREGRHGALQVFGGVCASPRSIRRTASSGASSCASTSSAMRPYHERELGRALAVSAMERA